MTYSDTIVDVKAKGFVDKYQASKALGQQPTLKLIRNLCAALNNQGIIYCHWKSNAMLDRSATGDNDLDLLIARSDGQRFTVILYQLGFKAAKEPPEKQLPGILNYYGYDRGADRLVHVHAHYMLTLGHDATKNYHLPIENTYLASTIQCGLFNVPIPEFELLVFVIRMTLKYCTWDAILARQASLSITEQQELEYLQNKCNQVQMYQLLEEELPYVDPFLFDRCMQALQGHLTFWARIEAGQQLQNSLKACRRRLLVADVTLKLWRRVAWPLRRRVLRRFLKKHIASGGLMIAVVGGDGAGKSTAVNELYAWLSTHFETIKIHMGKPAWSWTTIAVRGILKIGRSLGLYPFIRTPFQYTVETKSMPFPGYPWLLREVCTARDRYLTYARARRFAANGGIAICDRFPLSQVTLMDGPQSQRMTRTCNTNWLIRFLIKLETKYYQQIVLPDLLVVLRVYPETAVQRKTDEDAVSVRARSTQIWELDWQQTPAYVIDAGRSKAEVLSELKALVWSKL